MKKRKPSYLKFPDGSYIAYHNFVPPKKTRTPHIVFMGGFKSDMNGTKALFLDEFCRKRGIAFTRFDYSGHGESSGKFEDGTIGGWLDDALSIIDKVAKGRLLLVGSSLGGWLMLLAAMKRPKRIAGLIGIASAPDFTEDLIWNALKTKDKKTLEKEGIFHLPSEYCDNPKSDPYPITMNLIKEARKHLLLRGKIAIKCPVFLVHGMDDRDVPYQTSLKLCDLINSDNILITLEKNGDHRMSSESSLNIIASVIEKALETI